ncbi:MAG: DUF1203 domain-containing protein [Candidatus Baltobacteraceae bacterium]
MSTLFFKGMPTAIADQARATKTDAHGHALHVQDDQAAPCRHCLRITKRGEPVLLLSYNPFGADHGPYSEVGPVFVHADSCPAYTQTGVLPSDFRERELVMRAYNRDHAIEDSVISKPGEGEDIARRLFENENVAYIHVRHTTYGCFDFVIERG